MALLEIDNITKHYDTFQVLSSLSLQVEEHDVTCLIGPSGCGKSTLLRCINRLEEISSGSISIHGDKITGPGINLDLLRRDIGIVFQSYNLFPHMSVLDNAILAPCKVLGMKRSEAVDKAMTLLERVGLGDKAKNYPDRLSGGQQQRGAIVRALMMDPRLLLLDEITSALDPELVAEVLDIVRDLAGQGMTMILATHEMGFAREVANKVCFLQAGTIYEQGSPADVFGNPQGERTQAFLASLKKAGRL